MRRYLFLWKVPPLWALAEAWIIGLLILFSLTRLAGYVSQFVLANGLFFVCGSCGMWAVLRIRIPEGKLWRQTIWELVVGVAVSLMMLVGLFLPANQLGWQVLWQKPHFDPLSVAFLFLCTGPGYVMARICVRFWRRWDRMRRQRLLWSLTHAHLMVVVLIGTVGALGIFLLAPYTRMVTVANSTVMEPNATLADRLLTFVFPALSLIVILTVVAIAFTLPPSAIFSFIVARQTTRRLEKLAAAARAFRGGNYSARVPVAGEDEVAQVQSTFNAMAETMERTLRDLQRERDTVARLLQSRRELVANVSHELRTPIATVRATLDSALDRWEEIPRDTLRRDLQVAEGEITRLQGLIDDLFTLARAEVGGLALECRPTDIGPIIQRMVEAVAPLAWRAGRVQVVAEVPKALPQACVDAERLQQVLINLLHNGVRHTPPGGIVAAIVTTKDAVDAEEVHLRIEVRDTGEGIPPDDLPHIWERFYRGDNARTHEESGAGLGLALVKELTEAMGGTVTVESELGQGSCFILRLPRA